MQTYGRRLIGQNTVIHPNFNLNNIFFSVSWKGGSWNSINIWTGILYHFSFKGSKITNHPSHQVGLLSIVKLHSKNYSDPLFFLDPKFFLDQIFFPPIFWTLDFIGPNICLDLKFVCIQNLSGLKMYWA